MRDELHRKGMHSAASKDKQRAAMLACAVVITLFVVYWSLEIQAVREMLEMAYG